MMTFLTPRSASLTRRAIRPLFALLAAGLSLFVASAEAQSPTAPRTYLIQAGVLLATPGEPALGRQTIVVEGDRIVGIVAGYIDQAPSGAPAEIIDLRDRFVLPGLLDLHTHLAMNLSAPRTERMLYDDLPVAERAFRSAEGARRLVLSGFTTVMDVGGAEEIIFPLRDAINAGRVVGPRIFASGPNLSSTHGHGMVACDGVDACRRATRERIGAGADIVKIATGGSGSDETGGPMGPPEMFPDEIDAIVQTAAQLRRHVVSHSVSKPSIDAAIRGGVWAVTHGVYADDESFRLMRQRGVFLIPTTYVVVFLDRPEIRNGLSPPEWEQLSSVFAAVRRVPGRAYRAGVTLALGTDTGYEASADHAQELRLYVESGVPADQAIRAATVNAARVLGREDSLGQIARGFIADIIAVDGDPLSDIGVMSNVSFVMKDGAVLRRESETRAAN